MNKLDDIRKEINEIDEEMAVLFEKRMECSKEIAKIKSRDSLPVFDSKRESELIENNLKYIGCSDLKNYYIDYLNNVFSISKEYQKNIIEKDNRNLIHVNLKERSYDIIFAKDGVNKISKYFNINRKVLLITDDGVPFTYIESIKKDVKNLFVYVINQGEKNKSLTNYEKIINYMIHNEFTRSDCVIALGGGVVGDLAGFVASSYMRGVDLYNIPTTLLAQVDSSIGGKCAINISDVKNIVGNFYQPKKVLIDSNVLKTLDNKQLYSGLVEAIKMGATSDPTLFELIENSKDLFGIIDEVIYKSLLVKKEIVEKDQFESNIRKVLNFGHTIGHAIESLENFKLLHGECVGIGMLYFSNGSARDRIYKVLQKYNLPTEINVSNEELFKYISLDKKRSGETISIVTVDEIGKCEIKNIKFSVLKEII